MEKRAEMYGDSWRGVHKITSFADYIAMKLSRVFRLADEAPKTLTEDELRERTRKIKDQFKDTINYCLFAIMKLDEEVEEWSKSQ